MAWDGNFIWVGVSFGLRTLYKVDPITCEIVHTIQSPDTDNTGLAWDHVTGTLWVNPEEELSIYQLDPADGAILNTIPAQSADGSGLAHDGVSLWYTDYSTDQIYRLDPSDGSILDQFPTPGNGPSGLAYAEGLLSLADFAEKKIYSIDPSNGAVLSSCSTLGFDIWPWGLAATEGGPSLGGAGLWTAGSDTGFLYGVQVAPPSSVDDGPDPTSRVTLQLSPNPFNHDTVVRFVLPSPAAARLRIVDLAGRTVRTLLKGTVPAGCACGTGGMIRVRRCPQAYFWGSSRWGAGHRARRSIS
jgi:glutamine cyclotransferase